MKVTELRQALRLAKNQNMDIQELLTLLEALPGEIVLTQGWDVEARRILGWDKPIVLPMPKGRGARRG